MTAEMSDVGGDSNSSSDGWYSRITRPRRDFHMYNKVYAL